MDGLHYSAAELLAVGSLPGIGRRTVLALAERTATMMVSGSLHDRIDEVAEHVPRLRSVDRDALNTALDRAGDEIAAANAEGIKVAGFLDDRFPATLRGIPDPPTVVFLKGYLAERSVPAVAIVGTRHPSPRSTEAAKKAAELSVGHDASVISGLAIGCDAVAHQACIDTGGHTVAVLAHGFGHPIQPRRNEGLAERIVASGGALISEYRLPVAPSRRQFVERNRIQSGLAWGVFVVESKVNGGTMHTASAASGQGRPVACLSPVSDEETEGNMAGNAALMLEGRAVPITKPSDIGSFLADLRDPSARNVAT